MTDPEGIRNEPPPPVRAPEATVPAQAQKCPHCDHSLTRKDVEIGVCGYCNKRLAEPVQPKQAQAPFLATFLFGFVGGAIGLIVGYCVTDGDGGSWTASLCGGIGFASGSALARSLFRPRK